MSGFVTVALFAPRYFMIAGITVLAFALVNSETRSVNDQYFEQLLPVVIRDFVPVGLKGLLIAGLLAAFMSTFSGTINAAAAYLVNDVYKRYARPAAPQREYIRASYVASLGVVIAGCAAGFYIPTVARAVDWIVSGLWGGYAAANLLKWHWWRLNGYGYFSGMIVGIAGALVIAVFPDAKLWCAQPALALFSTFTDIQSMAFNWDLMAFPSLFVLSLVAAVAGSLMTEQQSESSLLDFYTRTRPWGWWAPVRSAALHRDPNFRPNRGFRMDMFNVVVGVIWQTAFVAMPIYVVIQDWSMAIACLVIIIATSVILKRTWYDRLESN